MSLFRKLFLDGDWQIAIRPHSKINDYLDYNTGFVSIANNKRYWFADPMLFSDQGKDYLFCEAFDRKQYKGVLGVYEIINGKAENFQVIIEENYHLSYPCVFEYENNYYMIPESGENNTINMYKAVAFPYKWVLVKSLVKGKKYADPTVIFNNDKVYLLAYNEEKNNYRNILFEIDMKRFSAFEKCAVKYGSNIGRPAGYIFEHDGNLIRPAQDSSELYGNSLIFYQIDEIGENYIETRREKLKKQLIIIDDKRSVDRIHTYSSTDSYEVIDYCNYRFTPFKRINILIRKKKLKDRKREILKGKL